MRNEGYYPSGPAPTRPPPGPRHRNTGAIPTDEQLTAARASALRDEWQARFDSHFSCEAAQAIRRGVAWALAVVAFNWMLVLLILWGLS